MESYHSFGNEKRTGRMTKSVVAFTLVALMGLCALVYGLSSPRNVGMRMMTNVAPSINVAPSTSLMTRNLDSETAVNMRHKSGFKRLGRPQDQRKALIRGLVTEVLRHGRITTTTVRAKAIRRYVDKMIGLAKRGDLHARRQAYAFIYDKELVKNLFIEAPKRYSDRPGGYTRVKKELLPRRGDNAELSYIELV
uniref:Large ribosomal subunit protein bL17c n=1 Tax=Bigelowiella natans TaxID=227086 RepID=Q7XYN8_BIGNA|nr:ribosomal protein rpL17 [Bigelowiella natans]|eukprot:jgi/Bigna1/86850/estExt_fgenesh1_pg.C_140142